MKQATTGNFADEMNRAVFDAMPPDVPYMVQVFDRGLMAVGSNSAMTVTWGEAGATDLAVAVFRTAKTGVEFSVSFDPAGDEKDSVVRMCFDAFRRL
ncbi:hypothetical protein ACKFRT_04190 [Corynebacterium sp. YSMAA1_1_F7]|uniref:hypothetical protein n=1 Tax=Corynebacterium sp. YSMAA1_1_F7 TaxID=3383590 RepID=UPI0038D13475